MRVIIIFLYNKIFYSSIYQTILVIGCIIRLAIFSIAEDTYSIENFYSGAQYVYLVDYTSGQILYEKNGHLPMVPSSMTKIMTVYMVLERIKEGSLKLSDKFVISNNAAKKPGSTMFLKPGQRVSIDELLKGTIALSGNDAAIALAESINGSEERFVYHMNILANHLGLKNTVFKNSTGWPDQGHCMTARDLSVLATKLISHYPEYINYSSIKEYSFNKIKQKNKNTLIGSYGVDGVKTGKTDAGGYGIVISAQKNNRRLIAVINGLKSAKDRELEAKKILDFGFLDFKNVTFFQADKEVYKTDVMYGDLDQVSLHVRDNVTVTIPIEYKETNDLSFLTQLTKVLKAPIKRGDVLGQLKIMDNRRNILIKEVDLVANSEVKKSGMIKRFFQIIKYFLKRLIS